MLGDDRVGRRLVPPQSIFGHAIRDRLHLVRSDALELLQVIIDDGDDEAEAKEKALAEHVARHPEDVIAMAARSS